MGRQYYFLISSLPLLKLGDPPHLSSDEFLDLCRTELPAREFSELARLSLTPEIGGGAFCEAARQWHAWETYIRNELARLRASHLGREVEPHLRPDLDAFPTDRKMLDDALSQGDPARREFAIDQQRWRRLDDVATGHHFDFDALVVYRLRLLLVEKWSAVDRDAGLTHLERLVTDGVAQAEEQRATDPEQTVTA